MNAQDYRKEVAPLFGELDLIHQYAATTSRLAEHHPDAVSEQDWFLLWTVLSVLVNDLAAEVR